MIELGIEYLGYGIVALVFITFGLDQYLKLKRKFAQDPKKVNTNGSNKNQTTTYGRSERQDDNPNGNNCFCQRRFQCCCNNNAHADKHKHGSSNRWNKRRPGWTDRVPSRRWNAQHTK